MSEEYDELRRAGAKGFRLQSVRDAEKLGKMNDARRRTKSDFIKRQLAKNERTMSNGESALEFFSKNIGEEGLYLLDEPENSLSPNTQLLLKKISGGAGQILRMPADHRHPFPVSPVIEEGEDLRSGQRRRRNGKMDGSAERAGVLRVLQGTRRRVRITVFCRHKKRKSRYCRCVKKRLTKTCFLNTKGGVFISKQKNPVFIVWKGE